MRLAFIVVLGCLVFALFGHCNPESSSEDPLQTSQAVEVLIDPGHGGKDPGAVSPRDGVNEKDAVLNLGGALSISLEQKGMKSHVVRSDDKFISLVNRIKLANEIRPNAVVSLHLDMSKDPSDRGFCVFYQRGSAESRHLALLLQKELGQLSYLKDNGVKVGCLRLLKETSVPAVSVYLLYVTNGGDVSILTDSKKQAEITKSMARAIAQSREL